MKKTLLDVSNLVLKETRRAEKMWGSDFDEKNTLNDWVSYINGYLARASDMGTSLSVVKSNLRKAAGLALSALLYAENDALAPRHYDTKRRPKSLPEVM